MTFLTQAGQAFSDQDNAVGDAVRIFVIVAGVIMMGMVIKVARQVRNSRQFAKYALVCFGISAIGTEIQQLGEVVTYRLLFNTAGVIFGLIFLWKTHHHNAEQLKLDELAKARVTAAYEAGRQSVLTPGGATERFKDGGSVQ